MLINVLRQRRKATHYLRKTYIIFINGSSRPSTLGTNRNVHSTETCMKVISRQRSSSKSGSGVNSPPLIKPHMMSLLRTGTLRITFTSILPQTLVTSNVISKKILMIQSSEALSVLSHILKTRKAVRMRPAVRARTPMASTMPSNTTQNF